jgi:hypothetical protein
MSFKPEVQTDATGKWYGNAVRTATLDEAERYVKDLSWRWTSVRDTRVVETPGDPVSCRVDASGQATFVESIAQSA